MDVGEHGRHDVITILVIQFMIVDRKGNAILCGGKGRYSLNMNELCRDCDVSPMDSDTTYIELPLKYKC